jgi:hypothetical protein
MHAGPQNVMFTACFAEVATGPQWNIYWPVNNKMGAMRMRVNHEVPKFIFKLFIKLNIYGTHLSSFGFKLSSLQ